MLDVSLLLTILGECASAGAPSCARVCPGVVSPILCMSAAHFADTPPREEQLPDPNVLSMAEANIALRKVYHQLIALHYAVFCCACPNLSDAQVLATLHVMQNIHDAEHRPR